jgi:RNA polymerase sigma-70 factor (ECF subfamily)
VNIRDGQSCRPAPDLVRAAQRGDDTAFADLYALFARMVHGVALARVPAPDVDDIVQEVFATAFARIGSVREPEAFGGWLAAIARNRAADYHRSTRPTVELREVVGTDGRHQDETLAVMAALRTLPEAYRETLTLRLVEGMTGPEIAERTGLTHGSVRVNLHRGMALLRERLAPHENAHE